MRKNFNFKAEWAIAIQSLHVDMRLCVYQIILTMGLNDVSLDDAIAANGAVIHDQESMALLADVEKILIRRRRARERAAARRLAKSTQLSPSPSPETTTTETTSPEATSPDTPSPDTTTEAISIIPRHRRHKHKKRKSRTR